MSRHSTAQILTAVGNQIALGYGFTRAGSVDRFDSTVTLDGITYHVKVEWPEGAAANDVTPAYIEVVK